MATRTTTTGILSEEKSAEREQVLELLKKAYWMEIETVMSYIANSVNLDGVRAEEIKKSLAADITDEIGHAQQFAKRVKELYGKVPGSMQFKAEQTYLQPPKSDTDVVTVIKGVIKAEQGAIDHMNADHPDAVTIYAQAFAGAGKKGWKLTGIDAEGLDLGLGDDATRVWFPAPLQTASQLRQVLVDLAAAGRKLIVST